MTQTYTHEFWFSNTINPPENNEQLYIGLLFNIMNGDQALEFVRFIDGHWFGIPDNYELDKYYPYNPPPFESNGIAVNDNHQNNS